MLSKIRLSEFRVMWVFVFYDLPTSTEKQRKDFTLFRKRLMDDGFVMFQFSVYIRHCPSFENAQVHIRRVKSFLPPVGKVSLICLTDKQFGDMQVFYGKKQDEPNTPGVQLELF